jgi:putative protease
MQLGQIKKPEVLAPAGELEQLYAAVRFGADAVYLAAKDFGMRSAPANFTFEELKLGCEMAHQHGVKVYQTVNVLPTSSEVDDLPDFLVKSEQSGVDAIIVADIGVMMLAKRVCPNLPIHISVQAGVVNQLTATELYHLGASRVVLARELTIEEIARIHNNIPEDLEIECFVHGAICMSFSGRCLISQYFVDRDANRGECAQPCRWEYHIYDPRNPERRLEVFENSSDKNSLGSYILNSKDLCLVEHIDQLVNAGISSLKIEGRAKSSFYVASVVRAYRAAVDSYFDFLTSERKGKWQLPEWISDEIEKISHREYTTGFYFSSSEDLEEQARGAYDPQKTPTSLLDRGYKQEYQPLAVLLEDGWHQRGKFFVSQKVDLLLPNTSKQLNCPPITATIQTIADLEGNQIPSAPHADQLLKLELSIDTSSKTATDLPLGTFMRGAKN